MTFDRLTIIGITLRLPSAWLSLAAKITWDGNKTTDKVPDIANVRLNVFHIN